MLTLNTANCVLSDGAKCVELSGRQSDMLAEIARWYPGVAPYQSVIDASTVADLRNLQIQVHKLQDFLRGDHDIDIGIFSIQKQGYKLRHRVMLVSDGRDRALPGDLLSDITALLETHPDAAALGVLGRLLVI